MEENEHTDKDLERALNIMDEGEEISTDSLSLLKKDTGVRQRCAELLELKATTRLSDCHIDADRQLERLHMKIETGRRRNARARLWVIAVAAAAAFIGMIFFINNPEKSTENEIFTAQNSNEPIVITDEKGSKKAIKLTKAQTYTISVSDYRRVMTDEKSVERMTISVPIGKMAHIDLPDGSVVLLHPGSRLKSPTAFIGDKRFVMLEGEAYFKIKKDPSRPFIVQADGIETTVLGTEFNIKDGTVTLINGSVKVKKQDSPQSVTMTPGQQASLIDDKFTVAPADTLPYVYWRDGYLYYDNVTIHDIMKAIGSTYNMTVRCTNSDVLQQHMRFMAERDKGVDAAIELMNHMGKVRVMRKDNLIVVE